MDRNLQLRKELKGSIGRIICHGGIWYRIINATKNALAILERIGKTTNPDEPTIIMVPFQSLMLPLQFVE